MSVCLVRGIENGGELFSPWAPLFVKREFSPKIGDKMGEKLGLRWEIVKQNLSENQNRQKEEPFILATLLLWS